MNTSLFAFGLGLGTRSAAGAWLETFFARPLRNPEAPLVEALQRSCPAVLDAGIAEPDARTLGAIATALEAAGHPEQASLAAGLAGAAGRAVVVAPAADLPPRTVPEAYLKPVSYTHLTLPTKA